MRDALFQRATQCDALSRENRDFHYRFSAARFLRIKSPDFTMKKIETIVKREALAGFCRCAQRIGVLAFELLEDPNSWILAASNDHQSRLKVDFAVSDREATDTVHAVLEQVHPDGIAIMELDPISPVAPAATPSRAQA